MNEEQKTILIASILTGIFLGGMIILTVKGCGSRWEGTYQTDWSVLGGCRVKVGDKFLPETNVREIER